MRPPLYDLLPAYLRNRDWYEGEPLRALLALLEEQHRRLEDDVDRLYDDWFVETCQERLVPLLGDLLGVRGLDDPQGWAAGQRTRVANSLVYRQAKGTAGTLARVARDVTGWPAVVRPGFRSLVFAQRLDVLRPERGRVVDLRRRRDLEGLDGPFDRLAHVARLTGRGEAGPQGGRGGSAPGEMGLHFWRLRSYPVRGWTARWLGGSCFSMHPLGCDMPLFTRRHGPEPADRQLEAHHLPRPLDRRTLARALAAHRRGEARGAELLRDPPFAIVDPATGEPVPWPRIAAADLGDIVDPATGEPLPWQRIGTGDRDAAAIRAVVDPERGRFAFVGDPLAGEPVLGDPLGGDPVRVSCAYGFSGDLGGGPYERPAAAAAAPRSHRAAIGAGSVPSGAASFPGLLEAVKKRPGDAGPPVQVLEIADSATYGGIAGLPLVIEVDEGAWLLIEAAPGQFPCYLGDLCFVAKGDSPNTRVTLSGLLIGGTVRLRGTARLEIRHCTLMPPPELDFRGPGLVCEEPIGSATSVRVISSIVGPLRLGPEIGGLEIEDSIVDGLGGRALAADDRGAAGPATTIRRSTLLGPVAVTKLVEAVDSLLSDSLTARSGSLRHCYCPADPGGPPRENCVPDEGLSAARGAGQRAERLARLRPAFSARRYGQPGYAQLGSRTPAEIRTGAASGSEIGAFESLHNPQRERNLGAVLKEYLPWGQEARISYES